MSEEQRQFEQPIELPGEHTPKRPSFKKRRTPNIHWKKVMLRVGAVLVIAIFVFVGFKFYSLRLDNVANPTPTTQTNVATPDVTDPSKDSPAVSESKTYKDDVMRIELTHPSNWKTTAVDGGVRIESPTFTYPTLSKGDVTGLFRIYIRKGARTLDGTYIGRGNAIKASEKLIYTAPEADQRTETLISSFGLDMTSNFSYFLVAGNFMLQPNDTLGPNYGKEPDTFIIVGGYSSTDLTDDLATNPVSPSYYNTTKAYAQALEIIKSLKIK